MLVPMISSFGFQISFIASKPRLTRTFGIMDEVNSDAFVLGNDEKQESEGQRRGGPTAEEAYDIFLGELVFSPNDPRLDIVDNADRAFDEGFLSWLHKRVETSTDPEEKMALRDLNEMILDVQKKMDLSRLAQEREQKENEARERERLAAAEDEAKGKQALSDAEVLRKATGISITTPDESPSSKDTKKSFIESEVSPEIRMSYEGLLQKLLPPYNPGETTQSVVYSLYEQCDAQLMKVLNERADNGDDDSKIVLDSLATEQQKRIAAATETLKEVLSLGDPRRMEGAIVKLARENRIDEAFLLLLQANAEQALAAGASGPAELMNKLRARAYEEKDKQVTSKEIRLLRKLLRADTSEAQIELLEDAFTPKDSLIVPGTAANAQKAMEGEAPEEQKPLPEVSPPDFINACKATLLNFGNLDDGRGDMTTRVKEIGSLAEQVATRIYGKGMTHREQQDRMWKEESTSIFDLETMEIQAEQMGETTPWANPNNDDILPGFDKDGKMRIGGG